MTEEASVQESEVTYNEGINVRVVRGVIIENNNDHIVIQRRDATITIMKHSIVKIETPNNQGGH